MIRAIVLHKWDDDLQDFVQIPLDDAEPWIIEVNRRFAGTNVSPEVVADLLDQEGFWDRHFPRGG